MDWREKYERDQEFKMKLQCLVEEYNKDANGMCSTKAIADFMFRAYNIVTYIVADASCFKKDASERSEKT